MEFSAFLKPELDRHEAEKVKIAIKVATDKFYLYYTKITLPCIYYFFPVKKLQNKRRMRKK